MLLCPVKIGCIIMELGPMKSSRRYILTFIGVLVFTAVVHADMMPVSQRENVCRQSPGSCGRADLLCVCENSSGTPDFAGIANLDLWSVEFLPGADTVIGQTSEMQHIRSLTDGSDSLKYCLSALISLGLCCSGHWVKRLSLGFIPEWYHEGGPIQIGHSHALMPGTLCPAQACCFIQPVCTENNHLPRYFLKTVISLWRKSQFTPNVIASRGPPDLS